MDLRATKRGTKQRRGVAQHGRGRLWWPLCLLFAWVWTSASAASGVEECPFPTWEVGRALPFGPEERLTFALSCLHLSCGRASIRVDNGSTFPALRGESLFAIRASVQTQGFFGPIVRVKGRMASFVDINELRPRSMNNHMTLSAPWFGTEHSEEEVVFLPASASSILRVSDETVERKTHGTAPSQDLLDVLALLYVARLPSFHDGERFCVEVYHRQKRYRIQGQAGPIETVKVPFGSFAARVLDATITEGAPDQQPRQVTAFVGTDDTRLPLLLRTENGLPLQAALESFSPGRRFLRPGPRPGINP